MSNREKEIKDKQAAFLEALLGEAHGNIKAAMDIAGYEQSKGCIRHCGRLGRSISYGSPKCHLSSP